jgi:phospholipid/cholesterol/gamma-HCH transport system substrate-binding protein
MSKSRLEWKVGLFVIICLAVLAGLLVEFSKGTTFWKKTYDIKMRAANGNGLKARAGVLMAGVQVGSVTDIKLGPEGTNVTVTLTIYNTFRIPINSDFSIEQSGFLGDQFVAVNPHLPTNGPVVYLQPGDVVIANSPWTLLGVANRVLTSLGNFDEAAASLRETIDRVRAGALGDQTLSNFASTVSYLKEASAQAVVTLSNLNALVISNSPAIYSAGNRLDTTLSNANTVVLSVHELIESNRPGIDQSISNLQSATHRMDLVMADVESGNGLAGKLLKDEKMSAKLSGIVTDLSVTSSNLNQLGLWRVLFPKHPKQQKPKHAENETLTAPKDRVRE